MKRILLIILILLAFPALSFGGMVVQTVAGGAPSGVTEVGTPIYWGAEANTGSQAITVNASADLVVYQVSGYSAIGDVFSLGSAKLCDATDCSGTSQDFNDEVGFDSDSQQIQIFTLLAPNTGSQYIVWDWSETASSSEGLNHRAIQFGGAVSISSNDEDHADPISMTVTGNAGDVILCGCDTYTGSAINWSGASEQDEDTYRYNISGYAVNTTGGGGTVTISGNDASYVAAACINIAD